MTHHHVNTTRLLRLGRAVGAQIGYQASLDEVARQFGFKHRQAADRACCLLLGRVVYQARKSIEPAKKL